MLSDDKGVILEEKVPEGITVNRLYYKDIFTKMRAIVRKKQLELWKNGFLLHQDNMLAHTVLFMKQFRLTNYLLH